jgi:competence protein ComEC
LITSHKLALDTLTGFNQKLPTELTTLRSHGNFFLFQNKRIAIIESIPQPYGNYTKLRVDYLVIRNNPKLRIQDLLKFYQPGQIIVDVSNSYYKTEKWLAELKEEGLNAHSIKKSGAFVVDL